VSAVVGRLESGESPKKVAEELGLDAADLIATLGNSALGSAGDGGPPLVQATPRHPRLLGALGEAAWEPMLPGAARRDRLALAAGLLQIHDFWDASHEAAQQADDLGERSTSAYWHGIAHRREPDSGNALYWFRRVGVRHPIFGPLAEAARTPLEAYGNPPATARLIADGSWNPSAFIALCADGHPDPKLAGLAHDLQRIEMSMLLDATASAVLA
jgi:hypothetical protein